MSPPRLVKVLLDIPAIRNFTGSITRAVLEHRRITMPAGAVLALLLADQLNHPDKEVPGRSAPPAAFPTKPETGGIPSPAFETPSDRTGINSGFFIPLEHDAYLEHQAMLAQAAAAEQARMLRFQQFQLQRESELRALNAELRARQAADRDIHRYQEDIGGHLHSILGE